MTASVDRRRRNTRVAAAMAVIGVLLVVALTVVGASTLADSRAGRDVTAGGGVAQLSMPPTATALLAVIDDEERLTSVVAMVLSPDGVGGSVVVVPPTADSAYGRIGDVHPLAETYAIAGAERLLVDAESLLAISFDIAEVVSADRLVELFGPDPDLDVEMLVPDELPDHVLAELPSELMPGPESVLVPLDVVAATLTAALPGAASEQAVADRPPADEGSAPDNVLADDGVPGDDVIGDGVADHDLDPVRRAAWEAIVAAVAGTGTAEPFAEGVAPPRLDSLDTFVERLRSGSIGVRDLRATVPDRDQNPRGADAVILDRPEVLLVFGQIAPGRVAAPNDSLTFRVESRFSDEQLAPYGVNNADVARDVIQILLFLRANVVSVETSNGGAPEVTDAAVADPQLIEQVEEGWEVVFGEVVVGPADSQLAGVDATVVLGESYLQRRDADLRRLGQGATDD